MRPLNPNTTNQDQDGAVQNLGETAAENGRDNLESEGKKLFTYNWFSFTYVCNFTTTTINISESYVKKPPKPFSDILFFKMIGFGKCSPSVF